MKINWKVRFKNKTFWIVFIPAVLLLLQDIAGVLGFAIDLNEFSNRLLSVVDSAFIVLALLGIAIDPTTEGLSDSIQALTYLFPKKTTNNTDKENDV